MFSWSDVAAVVFMYCSNCASPSMEEGGEGGCPMSCTILLGLGLQTGSQLDHKR